MTFNYNNYFVYDGRPSTDFGLLISGLSTWDSSEYDRGKSDIPGRNGNLINTLGKYENFDFSYEDAWITKNFHKNFPEFRAFMLAHADKYYKLEDTYHPGEYLKASFTGTIEPDYDAYNDAGSFTIKFNCMPQRWLIAGDQVKTYSTSGSIIRNTTNFTARPLIRVHGKGTITFGDITVTISSSCPYDYVDLDSDIYDAYNGDNNCNPYITTTDFEFPVFKPNTDTKITWGSGISSIDVKPRWWTL